MWYADGGPSTLQVFLLWISLRALFQYAGYNYSITYDGQSGNYLWLEPTHAVSNQTYFVLRVSINTMSIDLGQDWA